LRFFARARASRGLRAGAVIRGGRSFVSRQGRCTLPPIMAWTLTTWNVNSIRQRLDHVLTYLADHEPDVLCLQETKVEDRLFPRVPFMELGYQVHVHGGKALCGVATMTKAKAEAVHLGFREAPEDRQPRILQTVVHGVRIVNLYAPNGTELRSDAFAYKLEWFRRLRAELDTHRGDGQPVLLVGDFNIAPDDRDVYDPAYFRGRLLFTEEEHAVLGQLMAFGLVDCFRRHVSDAGHYSWYDYRTGGFSRDEGLRIDLVLASPEVAERCSAVVHDPGPRAWDVPSDHVPVTATFA
jgi:exodeoxyribonuclease III